jgi:hypothetical protein
MGRKERKRIDIKELSIMFMTLLVTIVILGFFFAWTYLDTPEYVNLWGLDFAWHSVAPYLGTAIVGFVMLLIGIKFKNN